MEWDSSPFNFSAEGQPSIKTTSNDGPLRSCLKRSSNKPVRCWRLSPSTAPPPSRDPRKVTFGNVDIKLVRALFNEDLWNRTKIADRDNMERDYIQGDDFAVVYIDIHARVNANFARGGRPSVSRYLRQFLLDGAKEGFRATERHSGYYRRRKEQMRINVQCILDAYWGNYGLNGWENKVRIKSEKVSKGARNFALLMGELDAEAARDCGTDLLDTIESDVGRKPMSQKDAGTVIGAAGKGAWKGNHDKNACTLVSLVGNEDSEDDSDEFEVTSDSLGSPSSSIDLSMAQQLPRSFPWHFNQ